MISATAARLSNLSAKDYFVGEVINGYGLSPVEASALYEFNYQFSERYMAPGRAPGQIVISAVALGEPAGKPLKECKLVPVTITYQSDEDLEVMELYGVSGLRRYRILRVSEETLDQGATVTHEQLAHLNTCDRSTVARDIKALRDEGIEVPTRGHMQDIGPGTSHKTRAVGHYLDGKECTDIANRMYHAPSSIFRYLDMFNRVFVLSEDGYHPEDIRHIVKISPKLCGEYLELIEKHKERSPRRLEELRERFSRPVITENVKKGGLV